LPRLKAVLAPGGEVWLIYDGPAAKLVDPILASLGIAGASWIRDAHIPGAFAIIARFG
jgi:hypothetical protein